MANQQLEFFPKSMETKMEEVYAHLDKMRKSLFARSADIRKELSETKHELATLKDAMQKYTNHKEKLF